jgi:hypothetical protein
MTTFFLHDHLADAVSTAAGRGWSDVVVALVRNMDRIQFRIAEKTIFGPAARSITIRACEVTEMVRGATNGGNRTVRIWVAADLDGIRPDLIRDLSAKRIPGTAQHSGDPWERFREDMSDTTPRRSLYLDLDLRQDRFVERGDQIRLSAQGDGDATIVRISDQASRRITEIRVDRRFVEAPYTLRAGVRGDVFAYSLGKGGTEDGETFDTMVVRIETDPSVVAFLTPSYKKIMSFPWDDDADLRTP